jgi:hypothetical protein
VAKKHLPSKYPPQVFSLQVVVGTQLISKAVKKAPKSLNRLLKRVQRLPLAAKTALAIN